MHPDVAPPVEKTSKAKELSEAVIAVAEKISPSVVQIDVTVRDDSADALPWWLKKKSESIIHGNGSGVIISADGYILTNNHVAATANGSNVDITLSDGTNLKGKLIGTDPKTDLAVFQAQNLNKQLTPAKFGNSSALRVGDTVLAIGSPLGLDLSRPPERAHFSRGVLASAWSFEPVG